MSSISSNSQFFQKMTELYNQAMKDQSVNKGVTADQEGTSADAFEPLMTYLSSGSYTGSNASSMLAHLKSLDDISTQSGSWSGQHGTDSTNSTWANDMDALVQMTASDSSSSDFASAVSTGESASGYQGNTSGTSSNSSTSDGTSSDSSGSTSDGTSSDSSGSTSDGTSSGSSTSTSDSSGSSTSPSSSTNSTPPASALTPAAGQTTTDLKTLLDSKPNAHVSSDQNTGLTAVTTDGQTALFSKNGEALGATTQQAGYVQIEDSKQANGASFLKVDADGNLTPTQIQPTGDPLFNVWKVGDSNYIRRPAGDEQKATDLSTALSQSGDVVAHNDANNHLVSVSSSSGITLYDDAGDKVTTIAPGKTGVIKVNNTGDAAGRDGLNYVLVNQDGSLVNSASAPAGQPLDSTLTPDGKGGWSTVAGNIQPLNTAANVPDSLKGTQLAQDHDADQAGVQNDVFHDQTSGDYFYKKKDGTWNVYTSTGDRAMFGALSGGSVAKIQAGDPGLYIQIPTDGSTPTTSSGLPAGADKSKVINATGVQSKTGDKYNAGQGAAEVKTENMTFDPVTDISYGKDKNGNLWFFDATGKRIGFVQKGQKASITIDNDPNNTSSRWNIDNTGSDSAAKPNITWTSSANMPPTDFRVGHWVGSGNGGYSDASFFKS